MRRFTLFFLILFLQGFRLYASGGWKGTPHILRISDAVMPGNSFDINGFGMMGAVEIAIEKSSPRTAGALPAANAIRPKIVQQDRDGHFLVAEMPLQSMPGEYVVRVRNAAGWSAPFYMNGARPLFISEREAYRGLSIRVSGRNLDGREFGVSRLHAKTRVRLNDGAGRMYEPTVTEVNPYCIRFKINDEPRGKYFIEVSNNDGINWGRLNNEQQLTILEEPAGGPAVYDPLGLGVSWASHFNWKNVHRVPVSDGQNDMTQTVQEIVNATAAVPGGGVVFFPDGIYKISKINLPENIVLNGESRAGAILSYHGKEMDFISCTGSAIRNGHVGIANLSIVVPKEVKERPDVFINLGQAAIWQGVSNIHLRTASEMFIYNVKLDYDFTETIKDHRGLPSSVIGRERYYIAHCDFKGFRLESHNYVSDYVTVRDNRFEFAQGVFIYTGNYLFLENNHIIGHTDVNREKHGFMLRANAYVYQNVVERTGSDPGPGNENWNDGEALCNETPGGNHNFGSVVRATKNSLTAGKTAGPFVIPEVEIYNHQSVMIVAGMGLGQYRQVARIDTAHKTFYLKKDWDVVPDETSRFTLIEPNENITYYQNTIIDNPKGLWLFGNTIDCVVAENTSIDCDGIFIFSCMYDTDKPPSPMYYFVPNYFNRIVRNNIEGVSRKSHRSGIGINCTREGSSGGAYFAIEQCGNEIRNNRISGKPEEKPLAEVTEAPPVSGIFVYATVHSSAYDKKNIAGDATNHIIENNTLRNLSAGINLSRCIYGQVLRNNDMDQSVRIPVCDSTGSQLTIRLK